MTTPNVYPPSQVPLDPAGIVPVAVWQGLPDAPSILLFNQDPNNIVYVGYNNTITVGGPDTIPIQQLSPVAVDGRGTVYAIALPNTAALVVAPGGSDMQASPAAVAETLIASGIAVAIAQAIAATGISLIAAPTLLYGGGPITPPTGAGLVGVTIVNFNGMPTGGTPNPTLAQVKAAEASWNTAVGRTMGANVSKRYFGPPSANNPLGELPSGPPDAQNCANIAASGAKLLVSLKPIPDTTGAYTATKYTNAFNALVACIAYLVSVATNGIEFVLWQECNLDASNWGGTNDLTGGQGYAKYVNFYGPAFKTPNQSSNQILVFDPVTSGQAGSISAYWNGGTFASLINKFVCDAYALDYTKGSGGQGSRFVGELNSALAIANAYSLPFGFWEWGVTDGSATVPLNASQVPNGTPPNLNFEYWNTNYIIGTMKARLNASLVNADVAWYVSGTGQNNPTADPTGTVTEEIQDTFDALTSAPTSGTTIAAGATVTFAPNSPSPIAGYASANYIGYDFTINLLTAAGSTNPFALVTLMWFNSDNPAAQAVDEVTFAVPLGTSGTAGTIIKGKGPMRGQWLSVQVQNLDTVTASASLQITGNSRTGTIDDWIWDSASSVAVPGYTVSAGGGSYSNQLGAINGASVGASSSLIRLFGMRPGEAFLRLSGEGTGHLQYQVNPVPSGFMGSAALINETPVSEFESIVVVPRSPLLVTITNTDTVAHNANVQLVHRDG